MHYRGANRDDGSKEPVVAEVAQLSSVQSARCGILRKARAIEGAGTAQSQLLVVSKKFILE